MVLSIGRWKPRHLLLAWIAYWVALVAVTLGPALIAIWRVSQGPENTGTVSASVTNAVATLTVTERGATIWAGTAHLLAVALWVAVPPLVLWGIWIAARSRMRPVPAGRPHA
jgi:hypothetical protein